MLAKARGEDEGAVVFAIVADGEVAGMIQHYEETDEEFRTPASTSSSARRTTAAVSARTRCGRWRAT